MEDYLIADIVTSFAAFCGSMLVIFLIVRSDSSSLSRRFLFSLRVVAALLGFRVLYWTTGIGIFDSLTLVAAGFIPLATILLTEGLLRRHAPFFVKMIVAYSAALFTVIAFLPTDLVGSWRIIFLLICQVFAMVAAAYLILRRDKSTLSATENRVIDRIALSLLLIVPFLVADYRSVGIELPVRLGSLAILVMCWLAVSLERPHLKNQDMIRAFAVFMLVSMVSGSALALMSSFTFDGYVQAIVIVLCMIILVIIYNDTIALRFDKRRNSLLMHLAKGDISTSSRFLQGLQNHELVEGALILQPEDLKDFDLDSLKEIFADKPIRKQSDIRLGKIENESHREHLDWLCERFNSTHVILANDDPIVLVALNMPSLSSSTGADVELMAVQRMAQLISRAETSK